MSGASTRGPNDPPEGWRWESYQDVQLAVPEQWGYGTAGTPWCHPPYEGPVVGRSEVTGNAPCVEDARDSETGRGGQFVWFEPAQKTTNQVARISLDRDRSIARAGSVKISVQATPKLRHQILDSIRLIDTDHNGCPVAPPFAGRPQWRPKGPKISTLEVSKGISACRYVNAELRSSTRLTGNAAANALAAVQQTKILGYGPNPPAADCVARLVSLFDQILLKFDAGTIALRYSGCFVPGLDDGTDVHGLTRKALQPFLAGPNQFNDGTNYWAPRTR